MSIDIEFFNATGEKRLETSYAGTCTTGSREPLTAQMILDAAKKLKEIQNNDQFIVVDPDGKIYIGTAQEVLPVVTRHHPLLKMPLAFDFSVENLG